MSEITSMELAENVNQNQQYVNDLTDAKDEIQKSDSLVEKKKEEVIVTQESIVSTAATEPSNEAPLQKAKIKKPE